MATDWASLVPLITAGVSASGQIAASRAAAKQQQAAAQVPVDTLNQRAYATDMDVKAEGLRAQEAALLARAAGMLSEQAAARKAPGERAASSVRGDILANAHDATLNAPSRIPVFEFGGGLRPSMFSGNTRQLGREMSRAALVDQLKGESTPFSDLPAGDFGALLNAKGAPTGTPLPQGSKLDSILSAINLIGGTGMAIANAPRGQGSSAAPIAPPQVASAPTTMPGAPVAMPGPPPVPPVQLAGRNPLGGYVAPTARAY